MPARDTYRVLATVCGEYEDEPRVLVDSKDYLSPGLDETSAMASCMRSAALLLGMEDDGDRTVEAIYAVLDAQRAKLLGDACSGLPATRALKLTMLCDIADALNLEWYGVRP